MICTKNHRKRWNQKCQVKRQLRPAGSTSNERCIVGSQRRILGHLRHRQASQVPYDIESVRIQRMLRNVLRCPQKQRVINMKSSARKRQQTNQREQRQKHTRTGWRPVFRRGWLRKCRPLPHRFAYWLGSTLHLDRLIAQRLTQVMSFDGEQPVAYFVISWECASIVLW